MHVVLLRTVFNLVAFLARFNAHHQLAQHDTWH
jgi:hypothetical protein